MIKKIFYICALCFVIALSALIAQKVFFGGEKEEKQSVESQQAAAEKVAEEEVEKRVNEESAKWSEKIIKIVELGVEGATTAGSSSQILYYQNQRFLLTDFNGDNKNSIGAYPFVEVKSLEWDAKKQKALIEDRESYFIYDLNDNSVKELGDDVEVAIWDYKGEKIVYKYYNKQTQKRGLAIINPFDETDRQGIVDELAFKKVNIIAVPKTSKACVYPFPEVGSKEQFKCFDWRTNEEVFVYNGEYGADYKWSPDGKRLLVSHLQVNTRNRLLLGVTNEQGSEFKGLGFSTTIKKCVWSKDSVHVYCAMMGGLFDLVQLPNDWDSGKYNSVDTFWKINTEDSKKERIIDAEQIPTNIDAENLFLDPTERYLFFKDRKNGNLYRLLL